MNGYKTDIHPKPAQGAAGVVARITAIPISMDIVKKKQACF